MTPEEKEIVTSLAIELSHYRLYEVEEIVKVITPYFKLLHVKILEGGLNYYEKEYAALIKEQSFVTGTKKYIDLGLQIAANKSKRMELRIALNNTKRDDLCEKLKSKNALLNTERDFLVDFIKGQSDFNFKDIVLPKLIEIQSEHLKSLTHE